MAVETGVVEGVRLESENFELWNGSTESRPEGEFPDASFQTPDPNGSTESRPTP